MAAPISTDAVCEIVAAAHEARTALEIRGNGTKAGIGGNVRASQTIELTNLSGILEYEMAELVLTARAGTRLAEIEAALAANNQMLAFEPADYGPLLGRAANAATIGGVLAGNIAGPRRLKDGAARDHFLGFTAVSGRGEVFKAGGKVVKNVTGYDLPKLLAGSWGTLAVMTEVTVKVLPRPATVATVAIPGLSAQDASRAMSLAMGLPLEISGAAHLPRWAAATCPAGTVSSANTSMTLLRIDGVAPSVAARSQWLRDALRDFGSAQLWDAAASVELWRHIRDVGPMRGALDALWRIHVPPMNGWRVHDALASLGEVRSFQDWAGGLVWLSTGSAAQGAAVHAAAQHAGGHAMLIRAPQAAGDAATAFAPTHPALDTLTRRVKAAFDPANILNPGRLFGA